MIVYDTYSVCNSENLWEPIQMQLFNKKTVSEVFAPDLKKDDSYNLCMSKITDCEIYDKWIKTLVSEHVWTVNMLKDLKHWWSLHDDTTTTLIIFIFALFINRLTTKHSFRNSENLPPRIQMQISRKQKVFSGFFAPFLKSTSHFELFEIKDDPHSLWISKIIDCKRRC